MDQRQFLSPVALQDYMHLPFSELYDRMAELHWEVEDVNP